MHPLSPPPRGESRVMSPTGLERPRRTTLSNHRAQRGSKNRLKLDLSSRPVSASTARSPLSPGRTKPLPPPRPDRLDLRTMISPRGSEATADVARSITDPPFTMPRRNRSSDTRMHETERRGLVPAPNNTTAPLPYTEAAAVHTTVGGRRQKQQRRRSSPASISPVGTPMFVQWAQREAIEYSYAPGQADVVPSWVCSIPTEKQLPHSPDTTTSSSSMAPQQLPRKPPPFVLPVSPNRAIGGITHARQRAADYSERQTSTTTTTQMGALPKPLTIHQTMPVPPPLPLSPPPPLPPYPFDSGMVFHLDMEGEEEEEEEDDPTKKDKENSKDAGPLALPQPACAYERTRPIRASWSEETETLRRILAANPGTCQVCKLRAEAGMIHLPRVKTPATITQCALFDHYALLLRDLADSVNAVPTDMNAIFLAAQILLNMHRDITAKTASAEQQLSHEPVRSLITRIDSQMERIRIFVSVFHDLKATQACRSLHQ